MVVHVDHIYVKFTGQDHLMQNANFEVKIINEVKVIPMPRSFLGQIVSVLTLYWQVGGRLKGILVFFAQSRVSPKVKIWSHQ